MPFECAGYSVKQHMNVCDCMPNFFLLKNNFDHWTFLHVSFDLSKLFYCLRQVLIHFVLNVCFPSNHILQIILAFQREKCSVVLNIEEMKVVGLLHEFIVGSLKL